MLAPRQTPQDFVAWNRTHGAPFGREWWVRYHASSLKGRGFAWRNRFRMPKWLMRQVGPFGFQLNSGTREFEYPWCFSATRLMPGMKVLEVGPGASGFQFMLAAHGCQVTAVDPLENPSDSVEWTFGTDEYRRLNEAFGGKVAFVNSYLADAKLPSDSFDRVYSISAIEHISPEHLPALVREIARVLKCGGSFIATVDLFLDCQPFTPVRRNRWGTNVSVADLVAGSGMQLVSGRRDELFGFPEFDPNRIMREVNRYMVVNDVSAQCFVMQKS
jgi:SAM-dependent methyltransferase